MLYRYSIDGTCTVVSDESVCHMQLYRATGLIDEDIRRWNGVGRTKRL